MKQLDVSFDISLGILITEHSAFDHTVETLNMRDGIGNKANREIQRGKERNARS